MAGRGPQSFKKRQREQLRKEKQEEKRAKRLERKTLGPLAEGEDPDNLDILEAADIDLLDDDTPSRGIENDPLKAAAKQASREPA
jgi:hypothetical protein